MASRAKRMWRCLSWCEPKGWDKTEPGGGGVFLKSLRKNRELFLLSDISMFWNSPLTRVATQREKPQLLPAWAKRVHWFAASLSSYECQPTVTWGVLNHNHPACVANVFAKNLASLIVGGRIPQSIWRVSHYFRISFLSQLFRRISEPSTDLEFESIIRMLQKLLAKRLDLMPHIDLLSKVIVSTTQISKKSIVWRPVFFQMGPRVFSQASFSLEEIHCYSV